MKNFTSNLLSISFLILVLLSGCYSSKSAFQSGNYESAVAMAAKKLRKNPDKSKQIEVLERAYRALVEEELARIEYLKLEGAPNSWVEIRDRYQKIDRAVTAIRPLLPLYMKKELRYADIELMNVAEELVQAKYSAADFLYAEGVKMLENNDRVSARKAHANFTEVKEMFPSYKDVSEKIYEAYNKGQEYVLITTTNDSKQVIPKSAFDKLANIPTSRLNSTWVKYRTKDDGSDFSKRISVVIEDITLGTDFISEERTKYQEDIEDGFTYQYDANGNVVKDTAGNDIKIPIIRRITAEVVSTSLVKEGGLRGSFRIYDMENNQMISNRPFTEAFGFNHSYITVIGDKRAVPKEIIRENSTTAVPFPTDEQMLLDGFSILEVKLNEFLDREVNAQANVVRR